MKKYILLVSVLLFYCCNNQNEIKVKKGQGSTDKAIEITITKVLGSPEYKNAKLDLEVRTLADGEYEFSFNVDQYELGLQTLKDFNYNLANSAKGQHIHFIVNNDPYSAHYNEKFSKKIDGNSNVILAFLSRSYHESVKNKNSFVLTQIGEQNIDLNNEFLFYSRPKGTYKGADTEKLLLDFYLINTEISADGNKVRATIQDKKFIIDEWAPYYIEGLSKGEVKIKLELIDKSGNLVDTPFNPSERIVILE